MELKSVYAVNEGKAEKNGIWIDIDDAKFHCLYYSPTNPRIVKVARKFFGPVQRLLDAKALPPDRERQLSINIFVESSLLDWQNVSDDGVDIPFSKEKANELFFKYPSFYMDVFTAAGEIRRFQDIEDDIKN